MYNIYYWLGRVACIYHGTARRECYKMLLISSCHIVMSAEVCMSDTGLPV